MRYLTTLLLFALPLPGLADSNIAREKLTCYQDGQQIFDISDRIRELEIMNQLKQIIDVNKGQVSGDRIRIYSVDSGNLVCVYRTRE